METNIALMSSFINEQYFYLFPRAQSNGMNSPEVACDDDTPMNTIMILLFNSNILSNSLTYKRSIGRRCNVTTMVSAIIAHTPSSPFSSSSRLREIVLLHSLKVERGTRYYWK